MLTERYFQPADIVGVQSHNCIGRTIRWYSAGRFWDCFPVGPNHMAQVLGHSRHGLLWWESSVTTRIPCIFCGQFKGVHARPVEARLKEEMRRGSTIFRYRLPEPVPEAQHALLTASWEQKHGCPYDFWGAWDARLRGGGRLLNLGLHVCIPNRATNGKWFCNEAVLHSLAIAGLWQGNPSRWNPMTAAADLVERGWAEEDVT